MASINVAAAAAVPVLLLTSGAVAHGVQPPEFDLQAHRGGLALRPENTLAAFGNALRLGVTTLELDVQITKDGRAVVTHDRKIDARKCGTAYAGRFVKDLTLAEIRTLDCGSGHLPEFPGQVPVPGATMPLLSEVFDLVRTYDARDVTLNVETKVEAGAPEETAPRAQFVDVVAEEIRTAGLLEQVTVQSFDWGALMLMGRVEPRLPLVALTNRDFLQTGQPGASPWLGGIDIDDFGGDPIRAVTSFGATGFSPVYGWERPDGGYDPYVTRDMVNSAHRAGLAIIPWTVDDESTMRDLIELGVDGLITDYPQVLREVLQSAGYALPRAYTSPFDIRAAGDSALTNPDVSTLIVGGDLGSVRGDLRLSVPVHTAADAREVHREVTRAGLAGRAGLQSYNRRALLVAATLTPRLPATAMVRCYCGEIGRWAGTVSTISGDWSSLTGPVVAELHDRDHLAVVPYGADDEAALQHVIDLGADGVLTSEPDKAVLVARRNGLR